MASHHGFGTGYGPLPHSSCSRISSNGSWVAIRLSTAPYSLAHSELVRSSKSDDLSKNNLFS